MSGAEGSSGGDGGGGGGGGGRSRRFRGGRGRSRGGGGGVGGGVGGGSASDDRLQMRNGGVGVGVGVGVGGVVVVVDDGNSEGNRKRVAIRKDSGADLAPVRKRHESDGLPPSAPGTDGSTSPAPSKDPSFMTNQRFDSLPEGAVHRDTIRAVTEVMKLERLTEIQFKTLTAVGILPAGGGKVAGGGGVGVGVGVAGVVGVAVDVLGRARTGTGKTVGFLMPAIQTVIESMKSGKRFSGPSVRVLIVSPTRELATQICTQAEAMLTFHGRNLGLSAQVVYGGTKIAADIAKFNKRIPTILVATPGRLKDHLQNSVLSRGGKFSSAMNGLDVLVLDEADQLLEMGFRPDIRTIVSFLPPKERRQTLLFSATMPTELRAVMADSMKPDYVMVDCVHDVGAASRGTETNVQVVQSHVIIPDMDRIVVGVAEVVLFAMRKEPDDHKIIVFFPTARLTGFFADLFNRGMHVPVMEMHSRKSQAFRERTSKQFRDCRRGVMFSSDVSARGVDYPDVTHVIQFGLPDSRQQYIHRLGRTGRAGRAGKGWLVLGSFESSFLRELRGVDCPADKELTMMFSGPPSKDCLDLYVPVLKKLGEGDGVLVKSAEKAYQAWLGFYNSNLKRMGNVSKPQLVEMANYFARLTGLRHQPTLAKNIVGKMGLKGVPGIKVV